MELRRDTRAKVDDWITRLTRALEDTHIQNEKKRLEKELAFLEHVRDERIANMSADELTMLNQRLAEKDTPEWIARSEHRP